MVAVAVQYASRARFLPPRPRAVARHRQRQIALHIALKHIWLLVQIHNQPPQITATLRPILR